jgi:hypothetical protein
VDLVVANTPAAMGADVSTAAFVSADGVVDRLENVPKRAIAAEILARVEAMART